jgi:hypothetical protein
MHTRVLFVAPVLLLVGCAAAPLTPQQEWVYKTFNECKTETNAINVTIDRVTPDGQIYYSAAQTQTEANRVFACMDNKRRQEGAR